MIPPAPPPKSASARHAAFRRLSLRFAPIGVIALALTAVLASGAHERLTLENLVASRDQLAAMVEGHLAWSLAGFVLLYAAVAGLSVPGASLLTIAGGFVFGGLLGGVAAVVGATAGATLLFLAARSSIGAALTRRAGPWLWRFRAGFQRDAVSYLLFVRFVSLFPFWLVNLALAATGVRLWTFIWTTFLGIIPGTFAYSLAGAGLDSVAVAQREAYEACVAAGRANCTFTISPQQLVTRELLIAFAALGFVALAPIIVRRWRARRANASGDASSNPCQDRSPDA